MTNYFQDAGPALLANGYAIVPIMPGEKRPAIAGWQNANLGPQDLSRYPGHGVGILCGQGVHPVVGVDIDVSHPVIGPALLDWCRDNLGDAPERVGAAPRVLLVYRADSAGWAKGNSMTFFDPADPTKPSGKRNTQQIEVLGLGQQFVAYHTHPDTGRPYEWTDLFGGLEYVPAGELPLITERHVAALMVEFERLVSTTPGIEAGRSHVAASPGMGVADPTGLLDLHTRTETTLEQAAELLQHIDNSVGVEYDTWVTVGMALHHQFEGSPKALALWENWSETSPKYVAGEAARKWRSFGRGTKQISIRWLIKVSNTERDDRQSRMLDQTMADIRARINAAEDSVKLTEKVVPEIRSMLPDMQGARAEVIGLLQNKFKELSGISLPLADARKMLVPNSDRAVKQLSEIGDDDQSDVLVSRKLANLLAGRYLYEHGGRGWLMWLRGAWVSCQKGEEIAEAMLLGPLILREGYKDAARAIELAKRAMSAPGITAALKLAQADQRLAVRSDEFDRDPELLNCANGVVNLRTGEMKSHDPAMRMSRQCPVVYVPGLAPPARWLEFLNEISVNDPDWIAYMQRVCGYALTGHVREEVMFFWLGWGANGKSVLVNVLSRIMGSYAVSVPSGFLMKSQRDGEGATPSTAMLQGARVALANEVEAGSHFSAQVIKTVCSTEPIAARHLYGSTFSFRPTHKLIVRGNHKPIITDNDNGIWRRIQLIPFDRQFGSDEKDLTLEGKLMADAPGILSWFVQGSVEYFRGGLLPAKRVAAASASYRKDSDLLGQWITDECETGANLESVQGTAYESYRRWCCGQGLRPITKNSFTRGLTERGFTARQSGSGARVRFYAGLQVNLELPTHGTHQF